MMNRAASIRSRKSESDKSASKHRFAISSLRGMQQPELSKRLYKLIKTDNHAIAAFESAGRETHSVATQLSDWGESTEDDALSEISDKLAVLLAEIGDQEDLFAQNLEDSRGVLKQIRNIESSVQPSRNQKTKIQDEIQKLKYKEPESTKLPVLEQELVRAEAQSLVAEAQLTNITRQKFKEAYDIHTAAIIERAEKQIILAKQARAVVNMLDDTPIVPGEERQPFQHGDQLQQVMSDTETQLRGWDRNVDPIHTSAGALGKNAMPTGDTIESPTSATLSAAQQKVEDRERAQEEGQEQAVAQPPYPTSGESATAHAA